ncbi:MAG: OB-fold nucleic acid binding domain-containing protein, partial [Candidatus Micrarchaeota archaeon]
MEFKHISEIMSQKFEGKEARVRGWIHRKRSGGGMQFIVVRDSTGTIQVAVKKDAVGERAWKDAEEALIESSVSVKGTIKADK